MTDTTPAKRAPRPPQDRKPKQSEVFAAEAANERPAGADLLKHDLPAWDQADAIATITESFEAIGVDLDKAETLHLEMSSKTIRVLGSLCKTLLDYAVDVEAYTAYVTGPGGLSRGAELAMWYFGELGEGDSSAS